MRLSQPKPPPRVRPAAPVVELMPSGTARPQDWVSWSMSDSSAPPPAQARRERGSTWTSRIGDRSITMPSSHNALPAMLWPPPFTASGKPFSRAKFTLATTSAVPAQRAIMAGRRSIMAFQIARASS